ncbi:MAG: tRNA (cytidine(56)-2'-O)-methyltransferase [Candidatus Bathyarchaeia archaeon]|jgi:tRNA (cytidine56-2'-O)-methyltransferase
MENSKQNQKSDLPKVFVLRWGHRPQRDVRLTTHVALTARALCASGFILSDVEDSSIEQTVKKITARWGGNFQFEMGASWKKVVKDWKDSGGTVVHLTAYGENIQKSDVLSRIKSSRKDVLVVVGSQKVPREFYSSNVSDFNVAVGNQPHSECSALAIFLDRFFEGKELETDFEKAKLKIVPQKRGKEIKSNPEFS